ncbi:hypothetical protein [Ruania halotolerans]|uniref:hypothetical protein n=1 Tax=Ruania halotolerans TaxID=2897773 RepID=UPI001E3B6D1C|nr:hypothetical protein [Ruania halotolerans]UFU06082.1 hypothetical protein LQF10_16900 [Ruania halotolerans]
MSMPAPPATTSTTGPKILTFSGAVVLACAIVVIVVVVRLFLSVLPLGVVGADGAPGPEAVGGTDVPGSVTLPLSADTTYAVYLAHPSHADGVALSAAVSVTGVSGETVRSTAGPSGSSSSNGVGAHIVHTFRTSGAGEYTVDVPTLADPGVTPWATVVIAEGDDLPAFFTGVFGTVFGVFAAIGLGVAGTAMTLAGVIWWHLRSRARAAVPPGYAGQPPRRGEQGRA